MRAANDHVIWDLIETAMRVEVAVNRTLRAEDLRISTYFILSVLEDAPDGLTCTGIAEKLLAEVPDMTRLLDRLERRGYATRERSKEDRREVIVRITNDGRKAVEALRDSVGSVMRDVGEIMSNGQTSDFRTALEMIRKKAEVLCS